ncbi:MAG: N-acetyltransferase [Pelagibacterales bacterium]|nr:N-acetyltransferase [Pelagibacterales bacterium]
MEINDNTFLRQFETKTNGKLAIIEYSLQDRKIFLTRIVAPKIKNKDLFVDDFIYNVLEIISERNISVVPTVPKITKYIRKNRRYKSLLPVGIRI